MYFSLYFHLYTYKSFGFMEGNKMKDYTTQQYEIEPSNRRNEVFQYNSRQWEENENNVEQEQFSNIDQCICATVKKYDVKMRQPPVHGQRKVNVIVNAVLN